MNVSEIFQQMPSRYVPGKILDARTYYFSVGTHKFTVKIDAQRCEVVEGKEDRPADVVLKTTPELFERMVVHGKMPGTLDVIRGRVKTNDPAALQRLRTVFDFGG